MEDNAIYLDTGETVSLEEKIGEGTFGEVFGGYVETRKLRVAVKLESRDRVGKCLGQEATVLRDLQPLPCVPRLLGQGLTHSHSYIVMERLGESINDKFKKCGRGFSLETVLNLGEKMITILQCLHAMKYVHRDIKPHNFTLSPSNSPDLYLIDFGLSKKLSPQPDPRTHHGITGTLPFVSLNLHYGATASRRDDLESFGYMLVYLSKGKLPWYSLRGDKLSEPAVKRLKEETSIDTLCEGLPEEFETYFRYVRGMRYEEEPDYTALKGMFRLAARRGEIKLGGKLDWELRPERKAVPPSEFIKSIKSTIGASVHLSIPSPHSQDNDTEDAELPSLPRALPVFDNSFLKHCKTDGESETATPFLTLSVGSSRLKRAKKFVGMGKMMEVVCASRNKLAGW